MSACTFGGEHVFLLIYLRWPVVSYCKGSPYKIIRIWFINSLCPFHHQLFLGSFSCLTVYFASLQLIVLVYKFKQKNVNFGNWIKKINYVNWNRFVVVVNGLTFQAFYISRLIFYSGTYIFKSSFQDFSFLTFFLFIFNIFSSGTAIGSVRSAILPSHLNKLVIRYRPLKF